MWTAQDPDFESRIRESFTRQGAIQLIGATLDEVSPGKVLVALPYDFRLTQQHGFLHAGMVATALDTACGYAAATLMPADSGVLSIEFKINLLAPAKGERFLFCGEVVKAGRTISVSDGEAFAIHGSEKKRIATMTCTLMTILGRGDVQG